MISAIIPKEGLTDISGEVLDENKKLKLFPAEEWKKFKWNDFRSFCHFYGRYGIPTVELVDFIKEIIGDRTAIEIGAGHGDLGYHLNIPRTDSRLQERPDIKANYIAMGQPVIEYPDDIEKLESVDAINKYKPQVVVASWITPFAQTETNFGSNPWGVREDEIVKNTETFIIIGNLDTHGDKPIRKYKHELIQASWIVSRGRNQGENCIFIWNKEK